MSIPHSVPWNHVTPLRLWKYVTGEGEFSRDDHDHMWQCDDCFSMFCQCLRSETFGKLLRELNRRDDKQFKQAA